MAYKCMISNKSPLVGNLVSHANRKTKSRQMPNLVCKSYYVPKLKRKIKLRICTSILRTIDKKGIDQVLKDYNKSWHDFV